MTSPPAPRPPRPPLEDRWHSRDFPVLLAVAADDEESSGRVSLERVGASLELEPEMVERAVQALVDGRYLVEHHNRVQRNGAGDRYVVMPDWLTVTERGRRAVGLWPNEVQAADALVDLLRQAEEASEDPEERTMIRRAIGALGSVSREVLGEVTTALVRAQIGI